MTVIMVIRFAPMTITMTTIKVMMTLMLMTMTASKMMTKEITVAMTAIMHLATIND